MGVHAKLFIDTNKLTTCTIIDDIKKLITGEIVNVEDLTCDKFIKERCGIFGTYGNTPIFNVDSQDDNSVKFIIEDDVYFTINNDSNSNLFITFGNSNVSTSINVIYKNDVVDGSSYFYISTHDDFIIINNVVITKIPNGFNVNCMDYNIIDLNYLITNNYYYKLELPRRDDLTNIDKRQISIMQYDNLYPFSNNNLKMSNVIWKANENETAQTMYEDPNLWLCNTREGNIINNNYLCFYPPFVLRFS